MACISGLLPASLGQFEAPDDYPAGTWADGLFLNQWLHLGLLLPNNLNRKTFARTLSSLSGAPLLPCKSLWPWSWCPGLPSEPLDSV